MIVNSIKQPTTNATRFASWRTSLLAMVATLAVLAASPAIAKKVGKASVPDSINVADTELPIIGAGLRTRAVFKLYAAALYTNVQGDGNTIAAADEPMAIHLHILSRLVTKSKMVQGLRTGFKASTNDNTAPIQDEIHELLAAMNTTTKRGDTYTLAYEPNVGTVFTRNGEVVTTIPGLEFKKALFGIWIGDSPVQGNLKKKMLGT